MLSLIIPAYNEASRLPYYLASLWRYLRDDFSQDYEILVIDDGSGDGLVDLVERSATSWPQLRCLQHSRNRGKGQAVRTGMLEARGDWLLFTDADGATPIQEEAKLRAALEGGADLAVGSRYSARRTPDCHRSWHRHILGQAFAGAARLMVDVPVGDPQCGFKMFRREVGQRLFQASRECGYVFDLEILALAHRWAYRIAEVPVAWREMPGSKIRLARDGWRMVSGLWRIRRRIRHDEALRSANSCPEQSRSGRSPQAGYCLPTRRPESQMAAAPNVDSHRPNKENPHAALVQPAHRN